MDFQTVFLSYERAAFYMLNGSDFRLTFDENILARTDRLSLRENVGGVPLSDPDFILMELKTSEAIPLCLTELLTKQRIFKTSFSKYGTVYTEMIAKKRFFTDLCGIKNVRKTTVFR